MVLFTVIVKLIPFVLIRKLQSLAVTFCTTLYLYFSVKISLRHRSWNASSMTDPHQSIVFQNTSVIHIQYIVFTFVPQTFVRCVLQILCIVVCKLGENSTVDNYFVSFRVTYMYVTNTYMVLQFRLKLLEFKQVVNFSKRLSSS